MPAAYWDVFDGGGMEKTFQTQEGPAWKEDGYTVTDLTQRGDHMPGRSMRFAPSDKKRTGERTWCRCIILLPRWLRQENHKFEVILG